MFILQPSWIGFMLPFCSVQLTAVPKSNLVFKELPLTQSLLSIVVLCLYLIVTRRQISSARLEFETMWFCTLTKMPHVPALKSCCCEG